MHVEIISFAHMARGISYLQIRMLYWISASTIYDPKYKIFIRYQQKCENNWLTECHLPSIIYDPYSVFFCLLSAKGKNISKILICYEQKVKIIAWLNVTYRQVLIIHIPYSLFAVSKGDKYCVCHNMIGEYFHNNLRYGIWSTLETWFF